jgi:hypothetical protein
MAYQPPSQEVHELPEIKFNEVNPEVEIKEEEMYAAILEDVHRVSPVESTPEPFVPSSEPFVPSSEPFVPSSEPFVPSSEPFVPSSENATKLTANYEAMTKDELLEICKTKGLRVGNRPGREKLLQLIRKSEDASELQAVEENDI